MNEENNTSTPPHETLGLTVGEDTQDTEGMLYLRGESVERRDGGVGVETPTSRPLHTQQTGLPPHEHKRTMPEVQQVVVGESRDVRGETDKEIRTQEGGKVETRSPENGEMAFGRVREEDRGGEEIISETLTRCVICHHAMWEGHLCRICAGLPRRDFQWVGLAVTSLACRHCGGALLGNSPYCSSECKQKEKMWEYRHFKRKPLSAFAVSRGK